MEFLRRLIEKILKERRRLKRLYRVASVLACIVVFVTTYALMLPAITLEKQNVHSVPGLNWFASGTDMNTTAAASVEEPAPEAEPEIVEETPEPETTEPETAEPEITEPEAPEEETAPNDTGSESSGPEEGGIEDVATEDAATGTTEDAGQTTEEENAASYNTTENQIAAENEQTTSEDAAGAITDQAAAVATTDQAATAATTAQAAVAEVPEMITEDTELTARGSDYTVYVTVTVNSQLPKGTQLQVREITKENDYDEYQSYYEKAQKELHDQYDDNTSLSFARFYDITFTYNGVKIEPAGNVTVRIEYDHAVKMEANASVDTIHFDEKKAEQPELIESEMKMEDGQKVRTKSGGNASEPNIAVENIGDGSAVHVSEVEFESGSFSVYGIVGTTIEEIVLASDGNNYKVSVTYGVEAGIPSGAELKVEELTKEAEDYGKYVTGTADAIGSQVDSLTHVRIFDIRIEDKNGAKVEPKAPVEVKIEYVDPVKIDKAQDIQIVHFGDKDTEVIKPETNRGGDGKVDQFVFEAESFSYYSVVSQESPTDLDGVSVALVTPQNAALLAEPLSGYEDSRLQGMSVNLTAGGTVQVSGTITIWTFEAVDGMDGWYYISDGEGNYLNLTNSVLTLGAKQDLYVGTRTSGNSTQYQIRTQANGGYAVNNYGNNWRNGFGSWSAGSGNNEWFRMYNINYLGDVRISFNSNGGNGAAPDDIYGVTGNTVTLPDYTGTRTGYTFLGWSTRNNLVYREYAPLYPAGSEYTVPDANTTLYAVWNSNTPATAEFYIRLDGTIPYEPDQYDSSAYTGKISITGAVINQIWVTDNDATKPNNGVNVINNVTANLNQVPTVAQLVTNINESYTKLGFKVQNVNGEVVVSEITNATLNAQNYNVSVGDALYVLWYVQKYAGSWHVDGALLVKDRVKIAYDGNASEGTVRNVPLGYQAARGTVITIGASSSSTGTVKTPTRPGYNFLGWNTKADGSGTWYNNNDTYTLNEDTTLYAQWSKGTNLMTVSKTNVDDEPLAGAQFKLEEKTSAGTFIEKATRTTGETGIFTYDNMENDTLYRLTETYAPNGYEVQNSFFFEVDVGESSEVLDLHVCDENGNHIDSPAWLTIDYTPAEDPAASGVARIKFIIEDERIERNITFIKTDWEGNPLPGAVYTLENSKGVVSDVLKSASDTQGIFSVENATLPYGTYTLTETKPPVTYRTNDPVTFTLNDYVSEEENGLVITGGYEYTSASCEVSSKVIEGLTVTTYSYKVTTQDQMQAHIKVGKTVQAEAGIELADIDTTIYYALTKKGTSGYVMKDGEIWIETMQIVDGVPTPAEVVFDGVDYGEYDVWEMALIDGEYTRLYSGITFDGFQLNNVSASSDDGGNNAVVSEEDLSAEVDFTNTYGEITEHTQFVANKRWTDRQGNQIEAPEGAVIEFTIYSVAVDGTVEEVRSIELDGTEDADGESAAWQATFKYLPIEDENGNDYSYKVKETATVDGYYPNNYPEEYYMTSDGGTITNRKLTTVIVIHKSFDVQPADDDAIRAAAEDLTFTLTCPDGETRTYTLNNFDNIADGDTSDLTLTLSDMPLGDYTLTETGQDGLLTEEGYDLVYSVSTVSASAKVGGTEQPVLDSLKLENVYAQSGNLTVTKNSVTVSQVDEQAIPAEITGKTFTFVVKRGELYLQEDGTLGTEPYEFSLTKEQSREFGDIPSGSYTDVERDASVEGYAWEVVDGTKSGDDYTKTVEVPPDGETAQCAVDNKYTRIEIGSLEIDKTVTGGPAVASTNTYKVTVTTVADGETLWLDAEGNLTDTETVLEITPGTPLMINNVTAGEYTVAEYTDEAAIKDYSLDVAYSSRDGTEVIDSNTVNVHHETQSQMSITNTYKYMYTPVAVSKTVTGNMGDKKLYFGFDAQLQDAEGNPVVVDGVTDSSGGFTFNLKHGESTQFDRLPKGATLILTEHNTIHDGVDHTSVYTTTVEGTVGTGEQATEDDVGGTQTAGTGTAIYTFTIPDDGATIAFTNNYDVYMPVVLKKVGYRNTDEGTWDLAGATFKIYSDPDKTTPVELDGKSEFTSDSNGLLYEGLLGGGTYYLDEITVPEGYYGPTGMFILVVTDEGVTLNSTETIGSPDLSSWITSETDEETQVTTYSVAIRNVTGYALPEAGGPGAGMFTICGIGLIVFALLLLFRQNIMYTGRLDARHRIRFDVKALQGASIKANNKRKSLKGQTKKKG